MCKKKSPFLSDFLHTSMGLAGGMDRHTSVWMSRLKIALFYRTLFPFGPLYFLVQYQVTKKKNSCISIYLAIFGKKKTQKIILQNFGPFKPINSLVWPHHTFLSFALELYERLCLSVGPLVLLLVCLSVL